jgi:streptogramin lyase
VHSFGETLPVFLLTSASVEVVAAALERSKHNRYQGSQAEIVRRAAEFEPGVVNFPKPTIGNESDLETATFDHIGLVWFGGLVSFSVP